ncbi:hypothetical protein [Mumia zhuanghuii]|uniref:Uncharacterized protein n=1 Tax=Mumia zhuanghuii TaxID=2585211 RepID=A0A5C4MS57_9ACTN|nr:hypothetical protein [Mumia zhuanghuii]TNC39573.1 hypothetical protein FHE65_23845 [Mumia zhuanghuii]TNC47753.1 hypothetical protein FHE65_08790 [Mumia zhuanghuii]
MTMPNDPTGTPGTSILYAVSSPSVSIPTAMAEVAQRLQDLASQERASEILAVSHEVTVVSAGDDEGAVKVAFTGRSRAREYVVSAFATIRA